MAKRISPETKKAILEEFSRPGITKAGIARKFNISPSAVSRIVAVAPAKKVEKPPARIEEKTEIKPEKKETKPDHEKGENIVELFKKGGVSESDLKDLHYTLTSETRSTGMGDMFSEFLQWVRDRDEIEKEKIFRMEELESLSSRKDSAEKEIKNLEQKIARLQSNIWDMKTAAERAHDSMSRVERRMELLEDRMNEDRGLLVLAAGLKSLIESGELGAKIISVISGPGGNFNPEDREAIEKLRAVLNRYIRMASSEFDPVNR